VAIALFWLFSTLLSLFVLFERKKPVEVPAEKPPVIVEQPKPDEEATKQLESLREQLAQTEKAAAESREKANQLLSENENLSAQLEKFSVSSSEQDEKAALTAKIEQLTSDLKNRTEEAEKHSEELQTLKNEQHKKDEQLAAISKKLEKAENDSKTAKREVDKTASQLKTAQEGLNGNREEIISLRKQLEEISEQLKAAQADARGGKNAIPPAAYQILYMFQKEGRLIDLLMEDIGNYDDETLGGALRPIHEGCRKLLEDRLILEPVLNEEEGSEVTLDEVDPEAIKLSGSVPANGPYTGELIHRGWRLKTCNLPELVDGWKGNVIAPAEIEIN
jgi:chemotaxis protein histidine kinase CheA